MKRRIPFSFRKETMEFNEQFQKAVARHFKKRRDKLIPPENTMAFSHGLRWSQATPEASSEGQIKESTVETVMRFDDILKGDIGLLTADIEKIANKLEEQFLHSLYAIVHKTTEKTGNIVNVSKDVTGPEAFIQMLEKIEFAVDRSGKPSLPEMHAPPHILEKLAKEIESAGPKFQERVEKITKEKIEKALAQEEARKHRFERAD